ncbi:MAG: SH3 domain-containing protein [Terriglobales bacterium]
MRSVSWFAALAAVWSLATTVGQAQGSPAERIFPQSKPVVEAAIRQLQPSTSGRLPVLDGFAIPGEQPLDRFQRAYYQCGVEVTSVPKGGSLVRVSAKITAWYNAPVAAKSGYEVLASNGRLESDLLDRLADALGAKTTSTAAGSSPAKAPTTFRAKGAAASSASSADLPSAPSFKANAFPGAATSTPLATSPPGMSGATDRHDQELAIEAKNLQEILHNQSRPDNLAAIRNPRTPVLVSPSEGAKVLFLADAEDEFEILDSNESWVHVRISGLSRGWIRLSNVEMPGSSESVDASSEPPPAAAPPAPPAAANKAPFQIENEQTASFPGDWDPLRGKMVRIVSIQKAGNSTADTGPQAKLAFVKELLGREYADLTHTSSIAAGIVVIFDSADGGMVAATRPALEQWKAGKMSDDGLWQKCYFDPPDMFHAVASQ